MNFSFSCFVEVFKVSNAHKNCSLNIYNLMKLNKHQLSFKIHLFTC